MSAYTWKGAKDGSEVSLPDWIHQYAIGWSGECIYLSTDEGERTVEIGNTVEHRREYNPDKSYLTVWQSEADYEMSI